MTESNISAFKLNAAGLGVFPQYSQGYSRKPVSGRSFALHYIAQMFLFSETECGFLPRSVRESPNSLKISQQKHNSFFPSYCPHIITADTAKSKWVPQSSQLSYQNYTNPYFAFWTEAKHIEKPQIVSRGSTSKISIIFFFTKIFKLDSLHTSKTPNTHHKAKQRVFF